jgi:hypothetical protein
MSRVDAGLPSSHQVVAALRQVERALGALADALEGAAAAPTTEERTRAVLQEWRDRGLTREQASALFRRHGFAPQTGGGWARGDWIEQRPDGLRYVTERSRRWLQENPGPADG